MAQVPNAEFSSDGQYYAFYHTDGKLKVWDTTGGQLKQEYTPNDHLNLPCTSLAWFTLPHFTMSPGRKKKRRTVEEGGSTGKRFLLLGLSNGSVLMYSLAAGHIEGVLQGLDQHSPIRSLACAKNSEIYGGCSNGTIVCWSLQTKHVISKWSSGKVPVSALLVHSEKPWLISGSQKVIVWDVETQQQLCSFAGHSNPISQLLLSPDGSYVVSLARSDRHINIWSLDEGSMNSKVPQQKVAASFVLPDQPLKMSLGGGPESGFNSRLVVITEGGAMHCFSTHINGTRLPPMKPSLTVQIASSAPTEKEGAGEVNCIPILGALVNQEDCNYVHIAHGSPVLLRFEKISASSAKEVMWLVRQQPKRLPSEAEQPSSSKIKGSNDTQNAHFISAAGVKRRKGQDSTSQLPIEQRINNLSVSGQAESTSSKRLGPGSDSMAHLLSQGLNSQDQKLLRGILLTRDNAVVSSTVARLPAPQVPALIQELAVLLHWRGWKGEAAARWLQALLIHHSALILSSPALPQLLGTLLGLVDARVGQLAPLAKLRGKLSLLLGQLAHSRAAAKEAESSTSAAAPVSDDELLLQVPLLQYQDGEESSSEELSALEDSDSEERWEESMVGQEESESEGEKQSQKKMVNGVAKDHEDSDVENGDGEEDEEEMELSS